MKANVTKYINESLRLEDDYNIVKRANAEYEDKTFQQKYKPLYKFLLKFRWVLALFSIITGAAYLINLFDSLLHAIISIVLGVSLIVAAEALKGMSASVVIKAFFKKEDDFISYLIGGVCLLLFMGSVFASVTGVKQLHNRLDSSVDEIAVMYVHKIDSTNAHHDIREKAAKDSLSAYKKSVSFKGRINIHNKATQLVIAANTKIVQNISLDREKSLKFLEDSRDEAIAKAAEKHVFKKSSWVVLSVFVELFIFFSIFFVEYYWFTVCRNMRIMTSNTSEPNIKEIGDMVTYTVFDLANKKYKMSNSTALVSNDDEQSEIGFRPVPQENQVKIKKEQEKREVKEIVANDITGEKTSNKDKALRVLLEAGVTASQILTTVGYNAQQVKEKKQLWGYC